MLAFGVSVSITFSIDAFIVNSSLIDIVMYFSLVGLSVFY